LAPKITSTWMPQKGKLKKVNTVLKNENK